MPPSSPHATWKLAEQTVQAKCQLSAYCPFAPNVLNCLLPNNGAGPCKWFLLCRMAQCEAMLAEGTGGTLEEEGVDLPGTSMLSSAGFCNTWLLGYPAPAVSGGQWHRHILKGRSLLNSLTEQGCWCNTSERMASLQPLQTASPGLGRADSQRVLLTQHVQPAVLLPSEPQLHPVQQGLSLSFAGGVFLEVVAAPNTCSSSVLWRSSYSLLASPPWARSPATFHFFY